MACFLGLNNVPRGHLIILTSSSSSGWILIPSTTKSLFSISPTHNILNGPEISLWPVNNTGDRSSINHNVPWKEVVLCEYERVSLGRKRDEEMRKRVKGTSMTKLKIHVLLVPKSSSWWVVVMQVKTLGRTARERVNVVVSINTKWTPSPEKGTRYLFNTV